MMKLEHNVEDGNIVFDLYIDNIEYDEKVEYYYHELLTNYAKAHGWIAGSKSFFVEPIETANEVQISFWIVD